MTLIKYIHWVALHLDYATIYNKKYWYYYYLQNWYYL